MPCEIRFSNRKGEIHDRYNNNPAEIFPLDQQNYENRPGYIL